MRCPICADEGRDLSEDNMCITHESMFFGCFQNPKHNSDQLSRIYSLRREMLISDAKEEWIEHNKEKGINLNNSDEQNNKVTPSSPGENQNQNDEDFGVHPEVLAFIKD